MHGNSSASAPTRYGTLIALMERMGWSWNDLCAAPADLVHEITTRMQAEAHWTAERARMNAQAQQDRQRYG